MTLNVDWFWIVMGRIGYSTTVPGSERNVYLPRGESTEIAFGDLSWTIPDAMNLRQIIITPYTEEQLGTGNEHNTIVSWKLEVERGPADSEGLGTLVTRASLTYDNSASTASPPPPNPVRPLNSTGEVWDMNLVILRNTRLRMELFATGGDTPTAQASNEYQVGLVGTWLRDIPE